MVLKYRLWFVDKSRPSRPRCPWMRPPPLAAWAHQSWELQSNLISEETANQRTRWKALNPRTLPNCWPILRGYRSFAESFLEFWFHLKEIEKKEAEDKSVLSLVRVDKSNPVRRDSLIGGSDRSAKRENCRR